MSRRDLTEIYREVKEQEKQKRQRANDVRELAWFLYNPGRAYAWKWWRIGFQSRLGVKVERHGFTSIPGYDTLATQVAIEFPEYTSDDPSDLTGTERLWEFLMSPYVPMPSKEILMREARRRFREIRMTYRKAVAVSFDPAEF